MATMSEATVSSMAATDTTVSDAAVSSVTASSATASETPGGPLGTAAGKVKQRVQEVLIPKVEGSLKVVSEKYEQLKNEYPSARSTLEGAEKSINDIGEKVARNYDSFVKEGDKTINEKLVEPATKVRQVIEDESQREEVKNAMSAGETFARSLLTLVLQYLLRLVHGLDSLSDKYLGAESVELIKVPSPAAEAASVSSTTTTEPVTAASTSATTTPKLVDPAVLDDLKAGSARVANRVYGYLLRKSTLSGDKVDFVTPQKPLEYIIPVIALVVTMAVGAIRVLCAYAEVYEGPADTLIRPAATKVLRATDFSKGATETTAKKSQ